MFLSRFFKRRSSGVVPRVQEWTAAPIPYYDPPAPDGSFTINLPVTVDGALLADEIEWQLKRRGLA